MAQFDESKHPRAKDGKFTGKGNEGNKEYRQNTSYEEITKTQKLDDKLPSKPKKSRYLELPKKEYAQMCSVIRTLYTNKIPKNSGVLINDTYYQFVYRKNIEQILCINKIKIEGNEEIIKIMEQNKND